MGTWYQPTKRRLKRQRVDHRDLDVLEEGRGASHRPPEQRAEPVGVETIKRALLSTKKY